MILMLFYAQHHKSLRLVPEVYNTAHSLPFGHGLDLFYHNLIPFNGPLSLEDRTPQTLKVETILCL